MAVIMGIIFFLSHQPHQFVRLPSITGVDKAAHAAAYAVLGASFLYGLKPLVRSSNRHLVALAVILFCLLYGISDELHQSFIPGRSVSAWDVAADVFGGALTVVLWYTYSKS